MADSEKDKDDSGLNVYGQDKTLDTVKLAKMNLTVNGLRGEIHQAIREVPNFRPVLDSGKSLLQIWNKSELRNNLTKANQSQKSLAEKINPFFIKLHELLKIVDRDGRHYEDVTGLCKLATLDEVKEQEYSLNPGRYVGVVIEEDGKTEEEFIAEIVGLSDELEATITLLV